MAVLDGLIIKELHCKNDDCRKLLGYERIGSGILVFDCPRCKQRSVFRIKYPKGKEMIDTLSDMPTVMKGGEQ